jgi:hypothetical protein
VCVVDVSNNYFDIHQYVTVTDASNVGFAAWMRAAPDARPPDYVFVDLTTGDAQRGTAWDPPGANWTNLQNDLLLDGGIAQLLFRINGVGSPPDASNPCFLVDDAVLVVQ